MNRWHAADAGNKNLMSWCSWPCIMSLSSLTVRPIWVVSSATDWMTRRRLHGARQLLQFTADSVQFRQLLLTDSAHPAAHQWRYSSYFVTAVETESGDRSKLFVSSCHVYLVFSKTVSTNSNITLNIANLQLFEIELSLLNCRRPSKRQVWIVNLVCFLNLSGDSRKRPFSFSGGLLFFSGLMLS